jgi:hypothetical protein
MEYNAFITSIAVSAFYVMASCRFMRLHRRTGLRPELWLGLYFGLTGLYYLGLNLPNLEGPGSWDAVVSVVFEWIYVCGVFPYLFSFAACFALRVYGPISRSASVR